MSDIFVSYKREEQSTARKLAEALENEGWNVWWDPKLRAGEHFDDVIEAALKECKCVVVMWSKLSVNSRYVKDEATYALNRGKLVPVTIEKVDLPFRFEGLHTSHLHDWDGSAGDSEYRKLVDDIAVILGHSVSPKTSKGIHAQDQSTRVDNISGAVFRDTLKDGSQGPEMIVIPAGEFRMGDIHTVTINLSKPFALGKFQITFDEYDAFAKATKTRLPNDQEWGRGRRPVIDVSVEDAQACANWLSEQTGKCYRLPSESEWEYAARSGGKDDVWAGTSNDKELAEFAWYDENSDGKTQEVGTKKSNGLGLHDMSGNVCEWVEDCWHENYDGAPTDGRAWKEENGGDCGQRVIRGGAWGDGPGTLRSSDRGRGIAVFRGDIIGFRLAQDLS